MTSLSVLMVEPDKKPYISEIENQIKGFEQIIGGPVDLVSFYRSPYKIVCCMEDGYNLTYSRLKPEHTFFILKHNGQFDGIDRAEAEELRSALKDKYKKWK